MPSHRANAHGTACEYYLAERYSVRVTDADGVRIDTSWFDGRRGSDPWEFKACAHRHADGQPGTFKIYEEYHERLQRAGGWYAFAVYRRRGTGTEVLKATAMRASELPTLRWHGGGEHRDSRQAKLAIEDVF